MGSAVKCLEDNLRGAVEREQAAPRAFPKEVRCRSLGVVGLFSGIGGFERGLQQAGHEALLMCDIDDVAGSVLDRRFKGTSRHKDVRTLRELPKGAELLVGGFPCQDLSQAGRTAGIRGSQSSLVGEMLRLLERQTVPWIVIENVPFMLQLGKGRAMHIITSALERLGYDWAYRTVDSRSFGLPQRRRRVFLVASVQADPRSVLFADDDGPPKERGQGKSTACGFYWTEGNKGLGWAVDAVPPLKGTTTLGYPSPPAVLYPSGRIITPDIRDGERLQGFPEGWTQPAEKVARWSLRWKLVGNAVTVPVAEWLGRRLAEPGAVLDFECEDWTPGTSWPAAAWCVNGERKRVRASEWPERHRRRSLASFLHHPGSPLSLGATSGFYGRLRKSSLNLPNGLLTALARHIERMSRGHAG